MKCYLFGVSRSMLNLSAVLLFLLFNSHVSEARTISSQDFYEFDESVLVFAAMLHRHGDRNPRGTYPNDPYKDHEWPGGYSSLTQKGTAEMYRLGLNLEPRYKSLKPANGIYTQQTAHHITSSPERTRMSGASMLAGFYKPYPGYNSINIEWQPVPMTVYPPKEDYTLFQSLVKCPKYDAVWDKLVTNPDPTSNIHQFNEANQAVYDYVSAYTGENVNSCLGPGGLHDILLIQDIHGMELPEWTKKVYPDETYKCRARAFQLMTETDYMKRVKGGPIVTEVYSAMSSYQNGSSARNLYTYSAHDMTISNALYSMKMGNQTDPLPNYGACLVFELRRILNSNQKIVDFVQMIYYADSTVTAPRRLEIADCPHPCTLNDFANVFQHLFVRNFTQECQLTTP